MSNIKSAEQWESYVAGKAADIKNVQEVAIPSLRKHARAAEAAEKYYLAHRVMETHISCLIHGNARDATATVRDNLEAAASDLIRALQELQDSDLSRTLWAKLNDGMKSGPGIT